MTILNQAELKTMQDVSLHKSDTLVSNSIEAVENNYVKVRLSEPLYIYLLENKTKNNEFVKNILEGCTYGTGTDKKIITGLKKAISILAFCDLHYKATTVTRYGAVKKEDIYSAHASESEVENTVSRLSKTALIMIDECLNYAKQFQSNDNELKAIIAELCFTKEDRQTLSENFWTVIKKKHENF